MATEQVGVQFRNSSIPQSVHSPKRIRFVPVREIHVLSARVSAR